MLPDRIRQARSGFIAVKCGRSCAFRLGSDWPSGERPTQRVNQRGCRESLVQPAIWRRECFTAPRGPLQRESTRRPVHSQRHEPPARQRGPPCSSSDGQPAQRCGAAGAQRARPRRQPHAHTGTLAGKSGFSFLWQITGRCHVCHEG